MAPTFSKSSAASRKRESTFGACDQASGDSSRDREKGPSSARAAATAASLAIAAGASVKSFQRMLGHASATLTLDRYGHLFADELDDVAARLDLAMRDADAVPSRSNLLRRGRPGVRKNGR
jgi:integrase